MHPARSLIASSFGLALLVLLAACSRTPAVEKAAEPVAASTPASALPAGTPAAAADYVSALARLEQATTPVSLEDLFAKAEAAQTALMEVTGEQAVLERFSAEQFAALQAAMRGLVLHREMDIYAQPEAAFFLALARAHGQPADVAFFEQYAATWGADSVPTYLKLRPQPTPCVRFGEGRIAPLYAGWQQFVADHPAAYATHAAQNLRDLEEAVTLGTCACDGLASVQREQAEFLAQFPNTPKAAEIRARGEQLVKEPDVLPVNCR